MFSFFHRSGKQSKGTVTAEQSNNVPQTDTALIAVISAAIARFREEDGSQRSETGFVVRRVRRI